MRFRSTIPLALGLLIAACAPEAEQSAEEATETTTQEYESPAAAIATLAANYEEHYNLGHASAVADLYTDDAIIQGSASEVLTGREAIAVYVEEFTTTMSPTLSINPIEQLMVGDWVLDRGSYTNTVAPEGGEAVTLTGNYMSLSQQTPDGLKLHRLTVNFDGPPPMPIPAPEMMEFEPVTDGPVAEFLASYAEHYNMGHASVVAEMWAEDGVSMFAERPLTSGRANIEALLAGVIDEMSPTLTIMDAETINIGEGVVLDRGSFKVEGTKDGQAVTRTGTYMVVIRQADDGSWNIGWGISNFAPMAAM